MHQVEAFYDRIWNQGDEAAAVELLAPGFQFRGSLGTQCRGVGEFIEYVRGVRASLAGYHCEIVEAVADGDRCFARMRFTGRHVGTLLGVPATGRLVGWDGAALFHVSDALIAEVWVLGDVDGLKAQLS